MKEDLEKILKQKLELAKSEEEGAEHLKYQIGQKQEILGKRNLENEAKETQKRALYFEKIIGELKSTDYITEINTFTYILERGEKLKNHGIKYYAPLILHKTKDIVGTCETIPLKFLTKILGDNLENFVNHKIPLKVYKHKSQIIQVDAVPELKSNIEKYDSAIDVQNNFYKIKDLQNIVRPKYVSLNERPKIKEKLQETIEGLNSDLVQMNKKSSELNQTLNKIDDSEIRKLTEQLHVLEKRNPKEIECLENCLNFNNSDILSIEKKEIIAQNGTYKGYALCQNGEVIARWFDDEWFSMIFSSSTVKPMKNEPVRVTIPDFGLIKDLLEVKQGDYIALGLKTKIIGAENIDPLYEKVKNGVEILPYLNKKKGIIRAKGERNELRKTQPPQPRHWGQEHLGNLATGDIIEGEFFATGFTYQAFPVKKYVIVEANEENRATYIFNHKTFDSLRLMPREKLIYEKPEGYVGRILHAGSQDRWKKSLKCYLKNDIPANKQKAYVYSFVVKK